MEEQQSVAALHIFCATFTLVCLLSGTDGIIISGGGGGSKDDALTPRLSQRHFRIQLITVTLMLNNNEKRIHIVNPISSDERQGSGSQQCG